MSPNPLQMTFFLQVQYILGVWKQSDKPNTKMSYCGLYKTAYLTWISVIKLVKNSLTSSNGHWYANLMKSGICSLRRGWKPFFVPLHIELWFGGLPYPSIQESTSFCIISNPCLRNPSFRVDRQWTKRKDSSSLYSFAMYMQNLKEI